MFIHDDFDVDLILSCITNILINYTFSPHYTFFYVFDFIHLFHKV